MMHARISDKAGDRALCAVSVRATKFLSRTHKRNKCVFISCACNDNRHCVCCHFVFITSSRCFARSMRDHHSGSFSIGDMLHTYAFDWIGRLPANDERTNKTEYLEDECDSQLHREEFCARGYKNG